MTTSSTPVVTIVGGSGFVGRYIAQAMARRGWRVRVACRRPNDALFVRPYGVVGQVEPVQCNVRDEASMRRVIAGSDAVVYSVGLLFESGKNSFEAVQANGPAMAARIAAESGVGRFVLISAIGADAESAAAYGRSKAAGETGVLAAMPDAVILRPSIIFGTEDKFFNRFAAMARISPIVPLVGADTRMQPVWVQDVAEAAAKAASSEAAPGLYELGGPRVASFRAWIEMMLAIIRRRRLLVAAPFFAARIKGKMLSLLPNPPLTADQVEMLRRDNVVSDTARGFSDLGIRPEAPEAVVESYLYPYRPYGQYTALTESRGRLEG